VEKPEFEDFMPLVFSPQGEELIAVHLGRAIWRISFPGGEHNIETLSFPAKHEGFGTSACYLSDNRVLFTMENGRMFLLNRSTMVIEDELVVEGHEPKSCKELFPALVGEKQLCGDVGLIAQITASTVVSTHHQLPQIVSSVLQDTIVCFSVPN
jgi:hypothetical protein